jgi:hypothetical protein
MTKQTQTPQTVAEALQSVQFVVGQDGHQTGIYLDAAGWEALLDWLEDLEDRALVQAALPRLQMRPEQAGALRWDEVEAEWNDEAA